MNNMRKKDLEELLVLYRSLYDNHSGIFYQDKVIGKMIDRTVSELIYLNSQDNNVEAISGDAE